MQGDLVNRLAVYGSLAPGRENHRVLEGLKGTWTKGTVRGRLHQEGWGATQGYLAMKYSADGQPIEVLVLESNELPAHWQRIDEFEGRDYRRILVPVTLANGVVQDCFIYALNEGHIED